MNNEARMKAEIAELREENKVLRDALEAIADNEQRAGCGSSFAGTTARAALNATQPVISLKCTNPVGGFNPTVKTNPLYTRSKS